MSQSPLSSDITAYVRATESYRNDKEQMFYESYENTSFTKYIGNYIATKKQLKIHKNMTSIQDVLMLKIEQDFLFQIVIVEDINSSLVQQIDDLEANLNPMNVRVDRATNSVRNQNNRNKKLVSSIDDAADEENTVSSEVPNNGTYNSNSNSYNDSRSRGDKVYKITLQDKQGNMYYALLNEYSSSLSYQLTDPSQPSGFRPVLGSKIIIRANTIFNRGMFLLSKNTTYFYLGSESSIKKWNENFSSKMLHYWKYKLIDKSQQTEPSNGKKRVFEY
ncbi:hypothetical protein ACO0QE_002575 [Hanseniaspora vineae]